MPHDFECLQALFRASRRPRAIPGDDTTQAGCHSTGCGRVNVWGNSCWLESANGGKFTPHMKMGRPAKKPTQDIAEVVRNLVMTAIAAGTPLSTVVLRRRNGFTLSKWQLES